MKGMLGAGPFVMSSLPRIAVILGLAACGEGNGTSAVDAAPDGISVPGIDAPGSCAGGRIVEGEVLDLGSTLAAHAGIAGATLTERTGTGATTTSTDGAFSVCATGSYVFDLDVPATHTDAIVAVEEQAPNGWKPIRLRTWTADAAAAFYQSRGLTYDPAKAQVFVVQVADDVDVTITGARMARRSTETRIRRPA
jgi:hypothetical protein